VFQNNNNITFRSKVRSKFNLQVNKLQEYNKEKEIMKPTFVSSLPPPILAKSPKEVNEVSKYFKKNNKPLMKKSYAQASSSKQFPTVFTSSITLDALKLKEMFPNLPNKKIDIVQKVINSSTEKSKPKISMITKGLSQKQVIVLMNNELSKRFIKDSSTHVINIRPCPQEYPF